MWRFLKSKAEYRKTLMRLIPTVHITQIDTLLLLYTRSDKVFENFSHECHKMWFGCVGDKASQERNWKKQVAKQQIQKQHLLQKQQLQKRQLQKKDRSHCCQPLGRQHSLNLEILKATLRKHLTKFRLQRSTNSSLMPPLPNSITTCCAHKSSVVTSHAKSITE